MTPHPQNPQTDSLGIKSVLIVDDHPLFCDALSLMVKMVTEVDAPSTAKSLGEALELLDTGLLPDVLILDLNLPDVTGLDGLMRLRARNTNQVILVVSSISDNQMISATLEAGAAGFIPKHSPKEVFQQAFETLRRGEKFLPPSFIETRANETPAGKSDSVINRLSSLTRQQTRILRLMCDGKLNKQIAFDLSIAEATVKAHITAILRKLNVQNRTQAVLISQQTKFGNLSAAPDTLH
jgi:DNA-binding NarL/FixJ family response regulator